MPSPMSSLHLSCCLCYYSLCCGIQEREGLEASYAAEDLTDHHCPFSSKAFPNYHTLSIRHSSTFHEVILPFPGKLNNLSG